ncbi:MAG: carbon monoxide dehydrogenase [Dehalococcoidia bacterium]|nr:MAG: carbon monoxide dehydrogenase [Dehalococcoidia bacterium]
MKEINTREFDIIPTTWEITLANRWDHFLARLGFNRNGHRVLPGIYSLGSPGRESPVFVTANYTLSFDALRPALNGIDCYVLVLDTKGVNVWCAAGKGTFGTDELVSRIHKTRLRSIVRHRTIILPQLSATGVAAHEVKRQSGFKVEYGPVRAIDLGEYMKTHIANPEMRRVRFNLADRLVLIPVELVHLLLPALAVAVALYYIDGWLISSAAFTAILTGVVLFPILLPFIPTKDFSSKGFLLGGTVALIYVIVYIFLNTDTSWWRQTSGILVYILAIPPITAFLALNFTGSTPIASVTSVRKEIFRYIRWMAGLFGAGVVLFIISVVI